MNYEIEDCSQHCLFLENDLLCKGEFLEIAALRRALSLKDRMINQFSEKNTLLSCEIEHLTYNASLYESEKVKIQEAFSQKEKSYLQQISQLEYSLKKAKEQSHEYFEWKNRFGNLELFIQEVRGESLKEIERLK